MTKENYMHPALERNKLTKEEQQDIVEFVALHMQQQGSPSMTVSKMCLNRTNDGKSCAIGCLLTDEEAHKFDSAEIFLTLYDIVLERWHPDDYLFFEKLRSTHDRAAHCVTETSNSHYQWSKANPEVTENFLTLFSNNLERLCLDFDLEYPGEYL